MSWWNTLWCWLTTNSAPVEATATAIAAIVAIVGIAVAVSDSGARSRPVVIALFRRAEHNYFAIDFVLRNYGPSMAKNVTVTFDPPITADRSDGTTGYLVPRRYSKAISALAPTQEMSNAWFLPHVGSGNVVIGNRTSLPDSVQVTVSYKGNRLRRYTDIFNLDLSIVKEDSTSESSTSLPGRIKSVDGSLKTIAESLKKMASSDFGPPPLDLRGVIRQLFKR